MAWFMRPGSKFLILNTAWIETVEEVADGNIEVGFASGQKIVIDNPKVINRLKAYFDDLPHPTSSESLLRLGKDRSPTLGTLDKTTTSSGQKIIAEAKNKKDKNNK